MQPTRPKCTQTLLFSVVVAVCQLGAPAAWAAVPSDGTTVLQGRLDALSKHFHGGQLARWSTPDDKAAFDKVLDTAAVLGQAPYTAQDVPKLVPILKAQSKLLRVYTNAGQAAPGSEKEARVRTKYQDEIVRLSAFLVIASAATLEGIGDFAAHLQPEERKPDRLKRIDQGRRGVRDIIESFNAELRLPGVSAENKMRLLDALAAHAATIATYSPAEDRKSYTEAAKTTLPWLSDAEKPKLQAFISAMDIKACKGLCLVKG